MHFVVIAHMFVFIVLMLLACFLVFSDQTHKLKRSTMSEKLIKFTSQTPLKFISLNLLFPDCRQCQPPFERH